MPKRVVYTPYAVLAYEGFPIRARQVLFGLCRHPVTSCALLPDFKVRKNERCHVKAVDRAGSGRGDQRAGFARRLLEGFVCGENSGRLLEEQVLRGEAKSLVSLDEGARGKGAHNPRITKPARQEVDKLPGSTKCARRSSATTLPS